jgi:hypothetical protein
MCGIILLGLACWVGFMLAGPLGGIIAFFGFAILYGIAELKAKK